MRVSDEMVERMCHAYNDAVPQHNSAQLDGMRAALEAAMEGLTIIVPQRFSIPRMGILEVNCHSYDIPEALNGKRVALVPLDD